MRGAGVMKLITIRRQEHLAFNVAMSSYEPSVEGVTIIGVDKENVARITEFRGLSELRLFSEFLKQGRIGVFALASETVVGHAWATCGKSGGRRVNGYFRLQPGQALVHHCNVREDWRGRRIYAAMLRRLCAELLSSFPSVSILVDADRSNRSSIRGLERAGFVSYGAGVFVQAGPFLLYGCQPRPFDD